MFVNSDFSDLLRNMDDKSWAKMKTINAVALKRELQKKAEQKLIHLSEKEQIELLRRRYGRIHRSKKRNLMSQT